ncbi:hypothetical protein COCCADRAFT_33959 [Bipolaris zeicola 26-R-13]|uniref:Uncharacterized protein n=1 Tax=Cochliobolus carbonum (strain 26-R-13) TaxID=930089 RepID=W6YMS3_COCC2|nr:uncharacterized protein COCCADRAFT_33959 [Bipolaris zeicola 26-R-13]EUC36794.1 hypothetical protein COCCADRAFT_33959 [Bipolaris zeicola 26-R-13]
MDAPTIAAALAGQKHVGFFPGPSDSVSAGPPCAHGVPGQAQSYTGTGPLYGTVSSRHIAHTRNSAIPSHRLGTNQPWHREAWFEYADKKPKKHKRSCLLQPMTSACAPCHAFLPSRADCDHSCSHPE